MIILLKLGISSSYIIRRYIKSLYFSFKLLSNRTIRIQLLIIALILLRSLNLIRIFAIYVSIKLLLLNNVIFQSFYNLVKRSMNLEFIYWLLSLVYLFMTTLSSLIVLAGLSLYIE